MPLVNYLQLALRQKPVIAAAGIIRTKIQLAPLHAVLLVAGRGP